MVKATAEARAARKVAERIPLGDGPARHCGLRHRPAHAGRAIATGVIEGTCRHLIKDRTDLTGARWGLRSAEAVIERRAPHSNGDWAEYWTYHRNQEHPRIHQDQYADDGIQFIQRAA